MSESPTLTDECHLTYARQREMADRSTLAAEVYPSRTRQRIETRNRVFEAAIAEFRRVGVAAAQIEDIVRAAGVARGTFYLHFATKDHVLLEQLDRNQQAVAGRLEASFDTSPRSFLGRTVDLMLAQAADESPALTRELFTAIGRRATEMDGQTIALAEVVTRFFAAAQKRGEVRTDLTPFELTAVFLPGVFGLMLLRIDPPSPELRVTLQHAVDVFVRGIAP